MRWWWIGMIAACGPSVATLGGDASSGAATTSDATTSAATTSEATTRSDTSSTTSTASTDADESTDTGAGPRRCFTTTAIDVDEAAYFEAARLRTEGPLHLLFGAFQQPRTLVVGSDALDGPWVTVQTIAGHEPSEVGDIDGDGRDEVVMDLNDQATWWQSDTDAVLSEVGPIADEGDADVLLAIPEDARAARASAGSDLEVMLGAGDGTFGPSTITPSPELGFEYGPPVVAHGEGLLEVGRFASAPDCIGFCDRGKWIFRVGPDGTATMLAAIDRQRIVGVADFDHDGELDVFVNDDGSLGLWRGPAYAEEEPLVPAIAAKVGDFDGDGFVDAMVRNGDTVEVHWNDAGALGETPTVVDLPGYPVTRWGVPVDLDEDGADEVVLEAFGQPLIVRAVACG